MTEDNTLQTLVVSPKHASESFVQRLTDTYGNEYDFGEVELATSLLTALQSLQEGSFDICCLAATFNDVEVRDFLRDFKKLVLDKACAFVQVHVELTAEFDRDIPKQSGFHGIISLDGSDTDREELSQALVHWRKAKEIVERKVDVEGALNVVLRDIDRAARDLKRGRKQKLSQAHFEFITSQTEFDDSILTTYFSTLSNKTQKAEPEKVDSIKVPEAVLKKKLPHLEEDKYVGVSQRVWKKLLNKLGEQKEPGAESESDSAAPPVESEEETQTS